MSQKQKASPASFLDYTPVPLTFGTSGLRGLVKHITDLEAYINVKGALRYLLNLGDMAAAGKVVLAGRRYLTAVVMSRMPARFRRRR
jgi:hypothetical protein